MTTHVSEYETKARAIAAELGLTVKVAFKGSDKCPRWRADDSTRVHSECACGTVHGDHYRVTLRLTGDTFYMVGRPKPASLSFDFWGSKTDQDTGEQPGYYNILACVASDASSPTDPDEVAAEYGPMPPSQAVAVAKWAKRLQMFFTESELARLAEVDR